MKTDNGKGARASRTVDGFEKSTLVVRIVKMKKAERVVADFNKNFLKRLKFLSTVMEFALNFMMNRTCMFMGLGMYLLPLESFQM